MLTGVVFHDISDFPLPRSRTPPRSPPRALEVQDPGKDFRPPVGGLDPRAYWSSFLVTFPVNFRYKAYSLAHMRTPTSVSLSVGEGVPLALH